MSEVGNAGVEKALGQAISDARRKAGMTQQDLCNKANLSYSTLAKIERGAIKTPSVFTVSAIADATGTTVEALAGHLSSRGQKEPTKDYKTAKSGVKFVYFDVNGVLVHHFQRAFTKIAADTGATTDAIESVYWHYDDAVCRGGISIEEFNQALAERLGLDKISWADYYLASIEPITEVHELLKQVAADYRVGLMSNTMPGLLSAMIQKALIPDLPYDAIADSSQVKCIKPEEEMYRISTEMSGVEPNEILLIDDMRSNLMAAEKFGWHVLWFDDYEVQDGLAHIRQALD